MLATEGFVKLQWMQQVQQPPFVVLRRGQTAQQQARDQLDRLGWSLETDIDPHSEQRLKQLPKSGPQ